MTATQPAPHRQLPPLLLQPPAPRSVEQIEATNVSSPSLTREWSTQLALMREDFPSHGAPLGWTTGAGIGRDTTGTVTQILARWRHFGDEMAGIGLP